MKEVNTPEKEVFANSVMENAIDNLSKLGWIQGNPLKYNGLLEYVQLMNLFPLTSCLPFMFKECNNFGFIY